MQVNQIKNYATFGNEPVKPLENEDKSKSVINNADTSKPEKTVQINPQEQAEDKFIASHSKQEDGKQLIQMPSLAQIGKMQTMQKVMGGTLFTVGALGALSFLSPKKWLTAIFTIPVGATIAYFGANMYNMANALDKLKQLPNPPQE